MSLKPSRRGLLIGMGATAADAVLPVQANTRDDPMAYRAAAELVEALAKRRVSSRELVDSAIARIEALDSKINAVVVRDFDRARAAAAAADAALAKGERRPLLGVPITVRAVRCRRVADHLGKPEIQGLAARSRCLGGTAPQGRRGNHSRQDQCAGRAQGLAELQRRLRHHQQSVGPYRARQAAPRAARPHRSPPVLCHWSSADIGGSLRAPAHFCGVFSHKPSLDLVPQRGSGPTADAGNTGARRSRRDRADGAQRRRPGSRIVGCRRTGRIDRGDRLQARAAATAARQAGGLSRPGYRQAPALSHRREHYHGAEQAGRSPSRA